jgi:hypothetical protein
MSVQYTPLPLNDDAVFPKPLTNTLFRRWKAVLTLVSLLNVGVLFMSLHVWRAAGKMATTTNCAHPPAQLLPDGLARMRKLPVAYVPFRWHTPWGSSNTTEADTLWDSINTAHGHIAVEHDWAAQNHVSFSTASPALQMPTKSVEQWLPSMNIPGKPGKGMYLLQAYHQLHCLVCLSNWNLITGPNDCGSALFVAPFLTFTVESSLCTIQLTTTCIASTLFASKSCATRTARRCMAMEIIQLEMGNCICAETGLLCGTMQRRIQHAFAMERQVRRLRTISDIVMTGRMA